MHGSQFRLHLALWFPLVSNEYLGRSVSRVRVLTCVRKFKVHGYISLSRSLSETEPGNRASPKTLTYIIPTVFPVANRRGTHSVDFRGVVASLQLCCS